MEKTKSKLSKSGKTKSKLSKGGKTKSKLSKGGATLALRRHHRATRVAPPKLWGGAMARHLCLGGRINHRYLLCDLPTHLVGV